MKKGRISFLKYVLTTSGRKFRFINIFRKKMRYIATYKGISNLGEIF